jgi:hypothetical protein
MHDKAPRTTALTQTVNRKSLEFPPARDRELTRPRSKYVAASPSWSTAAKGSSITPCTMPRRGCGSTRRRPWRRLRIATGWPSRRRSIPEISRSARPSVGRWCGGAKGSISVNRLRGRSTSRTGLPPGKASTFDRL